MMKRKTWLSALLLAVLILVGVLLTGPVAALAESPGYDDTSVVDGLGPGEPTPPPEAVDTGGDYLDIGMNVPSVGEPDGIFTMESSIPSKYNLVESGIVSSVKNQEGSSLCWVFSALSSMESNMINRELATPLDIDLSEQHFAYFYFNR